MHAGPNDSLQHFLVVKVCKQWKLNTIKMFFIQINVDFAGKVSTDNI